jgi:predicted AAA+ superfamily ATPase
MPRIIPPYFLLATDNGQDMRVFVFAFFFTIYRAERILKYEKRFAIFNFMIKRLIENVLRNRLTEYPAIALIGPRQAGKTTLAKSLTKDDSQWDNLIVNTGNLIALDEAQSWPEIFPRLRAAIDKERSRSGRFLLLGSVSPMLMTHVSESLAGRLGIIYLSPLLLCEFPDMAANLDKVWLAGGYPEGGALSEGRFPQWHRDYLSLLIQRDLRNWGLQAKPTMTERLVSILAALHGQLWNASNVSQALGISHPTVNTYLDYLEGAFLIRRLLPFHVNIHKRLVKSPKIYWRDSGLLHSILNVAEFNLLFNQPWVGASWEGFVIEQIISTLEGLGKHCRPFFFRTHDRHEIDLVLDFGSHLWAIEIKLTSSPSDDDLRRLTASAKLIGANRSILISRLGESTASASVMVSNLPDFLVSLRQSA